MFFQLRPTTIRAEIKHDIKKEENDTEYDYDNLVNEYYDEAINESRSKHAYHIRKSGKLHALFIPLTDALARYEIN